MGLIRLFLALLVVNDHLRAVSPEPASIPIYGGVLAVKLFFVISGFYMALVLDGKYQSVRTFYANRIFRLAPTYFVVVLLTAVIIPSFQHGRPYFMAINSFRDYVLNLIVVGQDVMPWTCYDHGISLCATGTPVASYVSQIWSVGIELELYFLAPFLLRSRPVLLGALIVSVMFYAFLIFTGNYHEPWNRMVMPGQLLFFCLGIYSFRVFKAIASLDLPWYSGSLALAVAIGVAANDAVWGAYRAPNFGSDLLVIAAFAALLPFVFRWTRQSRIDQFLGSLSYPIYVCHLAALVWLAGTAAIHAPAFANSIVRFSTYMALVLLAGLLFTLAVERPFERLRHRVLRARKPEVGPLPASSTASA